MSPPWFDIILSRLKRIVKHKVEFFIFFLDFFTLLVYNRLKSIKVGVCMKDNGDINKKIFVKNLNYYMTINNKKQADLVTELGLKTSTVSDWVNGKKYPRVDKMQLLADYFGILKSDLTEEHETSKLTDDIELQEYLEELKNRSEMRMLFSLAKGATKEDVEKAVKIIEALKEDD